jgi:excisionase family DNA binding protein
VSNEKQDPGSEFISSHDAAKLLQVSVGTILNMVERGALKAWRTQGGHRRIDRQSIQTLVAERLVATSESAPGSFRILVIEDDPQMREMYQLNFSDWQLPVALNIVQSGVEGLVEIGREMPTLLLLDLMMPNIDGFAVLRHVSQLPKRRSVAVVVISGLNDAAITAGGGLPKGVIHWRKPLNFLQLRGFIEGMLTAKSQRVA